jgi:hypothetical protein
LLGSLAALLLATAFLRQPFAKATLFFPADAIKPVFISDVAAADGTVSHRTEERISDPRAWAESKLLDKKAVDWLCNSLEQSELKNKRALLQSAVLLLEQGRLRLEKRGDGLLSLTVAASDCRTAVILCETLIAYLSEQVSHTMDKAAKLHSGTLDEEVAKLGRQLKAQESELATKLWASKSVDAPLLPPTSQPSVTDVTLLAMDYESTLDLFRARLQARFFGKLRAEYETPAFTVLQPPAPMEGRPAWWKSALAGALGGLFFALLRRVLTRAAARSGRRLRREPYPGGYELEANRE